MNVCMCEWLRIFSSDQQAWICCCIPAPPAPTVRLHRLARPPPASSTRTWVFAEREMSWLYTRSGTSISVAAGERGVQVCDSSCEGVKADLKCH